MSSRAAERPVLVFQIGSLGDTVIAIPCYREVHRRHPNARIILLTNRNAGAKMVPAAALLTAAGLISHTVDYPMPLRGLGNILTLYRTIRRLRPRALYYLSPE